MRKAVSTITNRQETILALIVREYIETSRPVGSKRLLDRYSLGVSSATVRNEMAALTNSGYLRQPYTSAGRIPTEAGYRYFVRRLLGETELPIAEKRMISVCLPPSWLSIRASHHSSLHPDLNKRYSNTSS